LLRKSEDFFLGEISGSHGGGYGVLYRVVWWKFTDVLEVLVAFIALMMEAASTCETSVNLHQTTRRNTQKTAILNFYTCFKTNLIEQSALEKVTVA
jgi:hypothetical protein